MTIAGVILAAGVGQRFEAAEHKLLVPFRGRPLVSWAVQSAADADALDEVIVVTGAVDLTGVVGDAVTVVDNPDWSAGQASSLQVGIAAARRSGHDAVVVGLGDSPLVPSGAWNAVARTEGDIVTATFGGHRRPPTKLARPVWDDLPTSGDEGGRALFRKWPDRVREVACQGESVDIDTLEDLAQWN